MWPLGQGKPPLDVPRAGNGLCWVRWTEEMGSEMTTSRVPLLPARVLGLPQSTEIDWRPDKKFRHGSTAAPAAAVGGERKQQVPLLARSLRSGGWFRSEVRVGVRG